MQECRSRIAYMECLHSTSAMFNGVEALDLLGEESTVFDPNTVDRQLSLHAAMEG